MKKLFLTTAAMVAMLAGCIQDSGDNQNPVKNIYIRSRNGGNIAIKNLEAHNTARSDIKTAPNRHRAV